MTVLLDPDLKALISLARHDWKNLDQSGDFERVKALFQARRPL